ncbi:2860_t:CDS:2, partial [Dentiscutata heterogama]
MGTDWGVGIICVWLLLISLIGASSEQGMEISCIWSLLLLFWLNNVIGIIVGGKLGSPLLLELCESRGGGLFGVFGYTAVFWASEILAGSISAVLIIEGMRKSSKNSRVARSVSLSLFNVMDIPE